MRRYARLAGTLTTRLIACLLIVLCFAVGAVGLILPIIPGLLFLAIALMLIASLFPAVDRQLRKSRTMRSYLDSAEGFAGLSFAKKFQYGCLLCLRVFVDTIAFCVYAISRFLSFAVVKYQSFR
jgi:uncharacterized membrane protein YbaN (DUF454 family)